MCTLIIGWSLRSSTATHAADGCVIGPPMTGTWVTLPERTVARVLSGPDS